MFILTACAAVSLGSAAAQLAPGRFLWVEHVVDGDGIWIVGHPRQVRLWGIDAPETGTPAGLAATQALQRLTAGHWLREIDVVEIQPATRRYRERTIARVFLRDGRDLSCEMIRLGHAVEVERYSRGAYARCRPADPLPPLK